MQTKFGGHAGMLMDQMTIASVAYHEAGHTVIAVAQRMPLTSAGIHIDSLGSGVTRYWLRFPGDTGNGPNDVVERERTIIALDAGLIAERKIYPGCHNGSLRDAAWAHQLLDEMYPRGNEWDVAEKNLAEKSRLLVEQHWQAIEALALALLAKPWTARNSDTERSTWSIAKTEKWITGQEAASILKTFELTPIIRDEEFVRYFPPDLYQ